MTMRKVFALLIIFSFFPATLLALSAANTVHAVGVIATIPVNGIHMAYDSGKNEIFVTQDDMVLVISDESNSVIATIPVGRMPVALAYDSFKNEVFVANFEANTVSVISDATNTVVATISQVNHPIGITYDSRRNEVFVANFEANTVSVISDATNTVIATVPVGSQPEALAYDPIKNEIFVLNFGDNSVSVISDITNTVVATVPVGIRPNDLVFDSGNGMIYVTNYSDDTVSVISDINNTVVATISVGKMPNYLTYDLGRGEIWVTTVFSDSISVISDSNNTVTATIPVGTQSPGGIVYDSGKGEIFVAQRASLVANGVISVISDAPNLTASSISASANSLRQGQTANLTSIVTTGTPPYTYQWFAENPKSTNYSLIENATFSDYSFVTSTSTATGNWSFVLQVTDGTQAAVNSTATTVTVNAALSPKFNETLITALSTVIAVVALGTVLLIYFKKRKH